MAATDAVHLELRSGARSRCALRAELEAEGLDLVVREPIEKRDIGDIVGIAVFTISLNFASDAVFDVAKPKIQAAIRRFREKDPNADLRGPDDLLPKR